MPRNQGRKCGITARRGSFKPQGISLAERHLTLADNVLSTYYVYETMLGVLHTASHFLQNSSWKNVRYCHEAGYPLPSTLLSGMCKLLAVAASEAPENTPQL